jgi:serine/threonine protein phosphatase PrpC
VRGFGEIAHRTDVGRVRGHNEDAVLVLPGLIAVADGMGGHEGGEVASKLAIEVLTECHAGLLDAAHEGTRMVEVFEAVFQEAASQIEKQLKKRGGTTLVCAVAGPDGAFVAHVGDSRAYLLEGDRLVRLTRDHNVYETMIDRGADPAVARAHPDRDKLTQALGFGYVQPDVAQVELGPQSVLMLCSDGLYGMVPDAEIHRLLDAPELADVADDLVLAANHGGGRDNISVALVRAPNRPDKAAPLGSVEHLKRLFLFADLDDAQLRNVAPYLDTRRYAPGAALTVQGSPADDLLLLVDGRARVMRGDVPLATVGPGDHVGDMALAGKDTLRTATVVAQEAVTALALTREGFEALCRTKPAIGVRVSTALSARLVTRMSDMLERVEQAQRALAGRPHG